MARRFATPGTQGTVSSSFKSAIVIAGTSGTRPKFYSFILSTLGAAADGVLEWILQRFTAAGTSTAQTPRNIDATDPAAAVAVAGVNHTVEPTYTANSSLFDIGINQRATYTWNAWTEGAQLIAPATAAAGIGIAMLSSVAPAYTGVASVHVFHEE
jgi:hypothetical protein